MDNSSLNNEKKTVTKKTEEENSLDNNLYDDKYASYN
jgi:hypothetical protein